MTPHIFSVAYVYVLYIFRCIIPLQFSWNAIFFFKDLCMGVLDLQETNQVLKTTSCLHIIQSTSVAAETLAQHNSVLETFEWEISFASYGNTIT